MNHKIQYFITTCMLLGIVILCTGCGKKENTNFEAGMTAVSNLQYQDALTCFAAAEEAGEDLRQTYRGQGLAYMGLVQYEDALNSFTKALAASNTNPGSMDYDINYYMAVCYFKLERYDEAIARYSAILALKPKEVDAYFLRGSAYIISGKYDEAIADFDYALSLSPNDYGLYIDIYCVLANSGYRDVGTSYLQVAMDSEDKKMSNYDKGRLYYYLNDYTYARNFLEQARTDGNKSQEVILLLGKSYEALEDYNYALTVYQGYLETTPDAEVYNQMGLCYVNLGEFQSALDSFQSGIALENCTCRQELQFNSIVAYENLENYTYACTLLQDYLTTYPDDETAQREYIFLQTR